MSQYDIILPKVRFRLWVSRVGASGSWVKVTLRPGHVISCGYTAPTAEGWHSCYTQVAYDATRRLLSIELGSDGRNSWRYKAEADITSCSDDEQPIWHSPSHVLRDAPAGATECCPGKSVRREGAGPVRLADADCGRLARGSGDKDVLAKFVESRERAAMKAEPTPVALSEQQGVLGRTFRTQKRTDN